MQVEYRLTAPANYVDMRWPMIVRIDRHTQPLET